MVHCVVMVEAEMVHVSPNQPTIVQPFVALQMLSWYAKIHWLMVWIVQVVVLIVILVLLVRVE